MSTARLLFGLFGGAAAWALHLALSYTLVAVGCATGWHGIVPALVGVTLLCLGVAIAAGVIAFRYSIGTRDGRAWEEILTEPREPAAFLMLIGLLAAAVFGLLILLAGLTPAFVPACA